MPQVISGGVETQRMTRLRENDIDGWQRHTARAGRSGCAANLTEDSESLSSFPESQIVEIADERRARGVVDDILRPCSRCCSHEPANSMRKRIIETRLLTASLKIQCRAFLLRGYKAASSACSLGLAGDRPKLCESGLHVRLDISCLRDEMCSTPTGGRNDGVGT